MKKTDRYEYEPVRGYGFEVKIEPPVDIKMEVKEEGSSLFRWFMGWMKLHKK